MDHLRNILSLHVQKHRRIRISLARHFLGHADFALILASRKEMKFVLSHVSILSLSTLLSTFLSTILPFTASPTPTPISKTDELELELLDELELDAEDALADVADERSAIFVVCST